MRPITVQSLIVIIFFSLVYPSLAIGQNQCILSLNTEPANVRIFGLKIPFKWKNFYEQLLQGKNPFQGDSDANSSGLYGLMARSSPELLKLNQAPLPQFEFNRPNIPFVIRMQNANLKQLQFILQYGFQSRARNLNVDGLDELESTVSANEDLFVDLARRQKQGMTATGKNFPTLFVETSGSQGWYKRAVDLVIESCGYFNRGKIIAKISPDRGVPVDGVVFPSRNFSDDEGGVLFLGGVKSEELIEVLYIDNSGQIFRYSRKGSTGAWEISSGNQDDIDSFANDLPLRYTPKSE